MAEEFTFQEPHRGHELALASVPIEVLEVIEHQRKPSPSHVKHVAASIERMGFVVPLVAVRQVKDGAERYVVIDGQHRLLAAQQVGLKELPVIVVPSELSERMLNLNIEKDPNIREKSTVALSVYRALVDSKPDVSESDSQIRDAIEAIHYVTLGLGYEKATRLAGSSFESILKRCDDFLDDTLRGALEVREQRSDRLAEANELVHSIVEKIREVTDVGPYVNAQIVSYVNPFKRKGAELSFDEAFEKVITKLRKVDEDPESFVGKVLGG
ncbi:MAG: ParB/RepB/Spo0J family partition protein [Actinomycetota bacterium]